MGKYLDRICAECNQEVEVYCDADNAMMCPECQAIDSFREIADMEDSKKQRMIYE